MPPRTSPRHALIGVPRRALGAAALAGAAGCRSVVDPPLPLGAVRFAPPPVYARWWAMTEACSGLTRDFGEVAWYVLPGAAAVGGRPDRPGHVLGYYSRPGSQLVLAGQYQLDGRLVRHEMLHALLHGVDGHPRTQYLDRCAGVVSCDEGCVADAGPAPAFPEGVPVVSPSALAVRAEVSPADPSASRDDGWFALTGTATNPAASAVTVRLSGLAAGFSYQLASEAPVAFVPGTQSAAGSVERVLDATAVRFGPGETKRVVFDLRVVSNPALRDNLNGGDVRLAPGRYRVRLMFGGTDSAAAPPFAVTLAP